MAANIFQNGGVDNNWSTVGNWSLGAIPTASDGNVATFNATSPNCTVDTANRVCNAIDFTGYTNTITFSNQITVSGSITLDTGMTFAGSSQLNMNASGTYTSNGKTCGVPFFVNNSGTTCTFSGNATVGDFGHVSGGSTLNGNTLTINGSMTISGTGILGTTNIILAGTGTWSGTCANNLTINTAGTITFGATLGFNTGTLTYTAGTIDATTNNSTFSVTASSTFAVGGMSGSNSFNNFNITNTMTLTINEDLYVANITTTNNNSKIINGAFSVFISGNLTATAMTSGTLTGTATLVMSGTGTINVGFTTGRLGTNLSIASTGNVSMVSSLRYGGNTFTVDASATFSTSTNTITIVGAPNTTFSFNGQTAYDLVFGEAGRTLRLASELKVSNNITCLAATAASHCEMTSLSGTQKFTLLPGATQTLGFLDGTTINSDDGQTVWSYKGTLTNASNWRNLGPTLSTMGFAYVQ